MSRSGRCRLPFDEARDFRFGLGEMEELQERADAGPEELVHRLDTGKWRSGELLHGLRLGLIGGGMPAIDAAVWVERYAGPGRMLQWKPHYRAGLQAFLIGAPDEDAPPSGETQGETTGSPVQSSGLDGTTS